MRAMPPNRFRNLALVLLALAAVVWDMLTVAAAAAPEMRIAFPSGMNGQIVVTMEKAGIAEQTGMKAQFEAFQYGPPMMEALAAGSIDAVVTSLMPVTSYASKIPGDIRVVAMVGQSSHSLMVDRNGGIATLEALAGKKLGVSFGSDSHLDTIVWLRDMGMADKLSLVNIAPSELATALANKSVDAIVIRQPQVLRLQQQSGAKILHTWPFRFVAIVKSKFVAEHPLEVEKFVAALRKAILFIAQNKQQAAAWFAEYLRTDPEIVQAVSNEDPFYAVTDISQIDISVSPGSRALIEKWSADAFEYKMIKRKLDLESLLP